MSTMEEKKRVRWCRTEKEEALRLLASDGHRGLSRKEAYKRLRQNGKNRFMEPPRQARRILTGLLRDPVLLLTLICGVLSVCFGELLSGLPFLVLTAAWGTAFVFRLLRGISRLETKTAFSGIPPVTVLREGEAVLLPGTQTVQGDVLILHPGDIVPCDCRLLSSEELTVRLVWKEGDKPTPHLYRKDAGQLYAYGDRTSAPDFENMVYGGSVVVSGSAVALAVELGETSFLGAMGERYRPSAKPAAGEMLGGILPYCRLLSFVSLLLLFLTGIVSLFAAPRAYTSLRVFLPVCVMTASASVAVTELYFTALLFRNRRAAMSGEKRARVLIRTDAANEALPYLDTLFAVGRAAFTDGKRHFRSACTGDGVLTGGAALGELTEAFVLLAKSREALSAAQCDRFTEPEDMTYLGELLRLCRPDLHALDIRLRGVSLLAAGEEDLLAVSMGDGACRLHLSHGIGAVSGCSGVASARGILPMTPAMWESFLQYCAEEEKRHRVIRTVVKESGGVSVLLGVLSLGEDALPDVPEQLERLRRTGVRVSVFYDGDEEDARRYFREICPGIPVLGADAFAEEAEPDDAPRVYTGVRSEDITERLKALKKQGRTVALLCNRGDGRQISGAAVRMVADDCHALFCDGDGSMPEPLPVRMLPTGDLCTPDMRDRADVILCRAGLSGGGIAAIEPVVRRSRIMPRRLAALLRNLTVLKTVRMLFFTLCALSGMGPPTAAEAFWFCFGGDTAALWAALTGTVRHPEKRAFRPTYRNLLAFFRDRRLWLPVLIPPAAVWIIATVLRVTGLLSEEAAQSLPAVGLALLQTVLLIFAEPDDVRMKEPRGYAVLAAFFIAPLLPAILLSVLIPAVGRVTGLGTWSPASVVLVAVCFLGILAGTVPLSRKDRK